MTHWSFQWCPDREHLTLCGFFFQPGVVHLPSYIWDTMHTFSQQTAEVIYASSNCLLVTLNVSSLYAKKGITACEEYLNLQESLVPPTADLCHLIQLILSKNLWHCHGDLYGTFLCLLASGEAWKWVSAYPRHNTSSVVEVYRWHLCRMDPRWIISMCLYWQFKLSQIHGWLR